VVQGKEQSDTFQKVEICADTRSFGLISEYACVNFFRTFLTCNTLKQPRIENPIQMIRGLRVMLDVGLAALYVVANCDHLIHRSRPSKEGWHLERTAKWRR